MGIDLFFGGAFVTLLFGLVCIYKTPHRVSLIKSIILCLITELCIGAVIAQIYSIAGLSIDLWSVGAGYWMIGVGVWLFIIKQHRVQGLIICKKDIYAIAILSIAFVLIFLRVFTVSIKNVYVNSDPAIHFNLAMQVIQTKKTGSMYFGELYNALFMSLLSPFMEQINLYKAFILADSFANFINLLMFYALAESITKSKKMKLLTPFFCILYFLGWPFFSYVLGGFVYFGWGVTLFIYIVYLLLLLYQTGNTKEQLLLLLLIILGCLCELICYMLFVPILGIVILYCLRKTQKKNKIILERKIKISMVILLIFGSTIAICIAYFGYFNGKLEYIFDALKTDGWIHKDLYRDFSLFIPAYLYMFWKCQRNKENNLLVGITTIIILIEAIALVACLMNYISPYYYYKSYYLLWVMAWVVFIDAMEYFRIKDKAIMVIYVMTLVCPMIMTLSGLDAWLEEKGVNYNEEANCHYPGMFPLLDRNEYSLSGEEQQFEDRDALVEACTYINSNLGDEKIPLITGDGSGSVEWWYIGITQNESIYVSDKYELEEVLQKEKMEYSYFMIHENTEIYRQNIPMIQTYNMIFSNGYYGIYRF